MEEYKIIKATTLTESEQTLYSNTSGAVVKTIVLQSTNPTITKATLSFDGVAFNFELGSDVTKFEGPIMTKAIKGSGNGVNVHITGLQL